MTTSTTSYAELYKEIKGIDRSMAPGSETAMWGNFLEAMRVAGIQDLHEPADQQIDAVEAQWWLDAYAAFEAEPDIDDVQTIYSRLG